MWGHRAPHHHHQGASYLFHCQAHRHGQVWQVGKLHAKSLGEPPHRHLPRLLLAHCCRCGGCHGEKLGLAAGGGSSQSGHECSNSGWGGFRLQDVGHFLTQPQVLQAHSEGTFIAWFNVKQKITNKWPPPKSQNLCSFCVTKIWVHDRDVNTDWRKSAVGCGKKHTLSYTYSGTFCFLRTSKQNQAKVVLKQRQGRGFSRQGCLPSAVQLQLYHAHTVHAISKSSHGICGPPRPTGGADAG